MQKGTEVYYLGTDNANLARPEIRKATIRQVRETGFAVGDLYAIPKDRAFASLEDASKLYETELEAYIAELRVELAEAKEKLATLHEEGFVSVRSR